MYIRFLVPHRVASELLFRREFASASPIEIIRDTKTN